ncbi:MAG: slipin family protein [Armatimonadetes bacterium]|nr:slipin family protein [Armatimonadota bacterium]
MQGIGVFIGVLALVFIMVVLNSIRIIREWERGVLLRLGRFHSVKTPGIRVVWPIIDKMQIMDLRIITMDVTKQEMMTTDNVPVTVDAVIYFQVVNAENAIIKVENYIKATSLIAQTTLRSVVGQSELDELLAQRDRLNQRLQTIIDEQTEPWGIKVTAVEIRDVILPDSMKRAMARQAEVERERRAKIINAEGEFQAAQKLRDAAEIISGNPQALQLRYLQTLTEVAAEHNSTTLFPIPLDLFTPFIKQALSAAKEPEGRQNG